MMGEEELYQLIDGCVKQDRKSQKMLYKAFLKVFTHIKTFDVSRPFKGWLGKIMTNVSIDYYRANLKMAYTDDLDKAEGMTDGELPDRKLNYDDLLAMIQK